ncbi:MAG: hypothetical protein CVU52_10790 [Deltaproteobacteria bacterium HGW-Deltaproteobacteria-10]|nr:MAG: hypothetical protein CVU52_10790 [Deltaproteobacteria bacterium HGW-Deltaproteobacteria-10]
MNDKKEAVKNLKEYYEAARKSLIAKMKIEEEEQTNLKIKIATFVIYELSHSTHSWFKDYFLSDISKNTGNIEIINNKKILKVESAFFNVIADYLITMEAEDGYAEKILSSLKEEEQKKNFWKPIVFDAFLLAGIYFTLPPESGKKSRNRRGGGQTEKKTKPLFLCQMLSEGTVF